MCPQQKTLRSIDLRDEFTLAVPPCLSPKGDHSSGSNKPYPCNGGDRIPLLTFTGSTQEPDRQDLSHRLAPSAGSLEHPIKASFPSMSFEVFGIFPIISIKGQFCQQKNPFSNRRMKKFKKSCPFVRKMFDFCGRTC